MTSVDHLLDAAADKLEGFVAEARSSGGVKQKLGDALAEDPAFLRKLKPSLVARRAKGQPAETGARPRVQPARPRPPRRRSGPSPWLVVGVAFAGGLLLAKAIDWRGHAHPRD
jgi:hypothetical protein